MATNNSINQYNPQACFMVRPANNKVNVTGGGVAYTVAFDEIIYDNTSSFNIGTYTFVAPYTGRYFLAANVQLSNLPAILNSLLINIDTSVTDCGSIWTSNNSKSVGNLYILQSSFIVSLVVGSTATVSVNSSGGTQTVSVDTTSAVDPLTFFCGYLIR